MLYTKILRSALFAGLCAIFFVPFIIADGTWFPNMFFPYITGKNFAFRILVEVLLGMYVLLALREPKYRPKSSYILYALGAFVLWIGLATAVSVDPIKSFWSNFERMEGYVTMLHLFAYFLLVSAMVGAENRWDRFFQASIVSSVIMGCYGVLQLVGSIPISSQSGARVDTTFGNATYLAVFMFFNVFITLFMLVRQRKSVGAQVFYGIALVLQLMTLYHTQTRGAILGLLGGLIIAALYIALRGKTAEWRGLRTVSLWGLGVLAAVIVLFLALRTTPIVQKSDTLNRLSSISLSDPTTIARFYIWDMAWRGAIDSPKTTIAGWGQENFNFVFNKYYNPKMYNQEQWFDRAHNQFLDWLIAGGLPAFALYISFFALIALAIIRSELTVPEQAVLLGLLGGYTFNNLFVFDDLMSSVYFFLVLALAHSLSLKKLPGLLVLSKPMGDQGVAVAAPVVAAVVILGAWCLNGPGIARAQNLLDAVMTQMAVPDGNGGITGAPKDPKDNLAQFKIALGEGVWPGTALGLQETTEQLLQFSSNQAQSNIDPSVKQDTHDLAEEAGVAINTKRPHDARLELFMGVFYASFGQHAQSTQWLGKALADSPSKQQILFQVGIDAVNAGDSAKAVAVMKQAFDEEPNFESARIMYASALYYAGDTARADALLTDKFGSVLVDDNRLIQVFTATKQYGRVVSIWQKRIAANPNDAQQYIGLAGVYFTAGDTANTIATLQKAAAIDPSLATQVKTVIEQLQNGTLKAGQ